MNNYREFEIALKEIIPDLSHIRLAMGLNPDDKDMDLFISRLIEEISELFSPKVGYRIIKDVSLFPESYEIKLDNVKFEIGKILFGQIKESCGIIQFVATAGEECDRWIKRNYKENGALSGFIADVIGSEIVENACDYLDNYLADIIMKEEQMSCSNRFSPGYCSWKTEEQQKFFSLLPPKPCGINLTESSLMIPTKSVSGIIGFGQILRKLEYPCKICSYEKCYKRRKNN